MNVSIWVYMSPKAYTARTSGAPDFSIAASSCKYRLPTRYINVVEIENWATRRA